MHYFGVPKLWSIQSTPLDPKWCLGVFWSILLTFGTWKLQNLCLSHNTLFRGIEVVKHPFCSIWPKMMFGSVSEHFDNLRQVKRCKTCVSGLNTLFPDVKVVKHPFYSIWPKMMFRSVSEHFANLWQVKSCKTCVSGLNTLFRGTEVVKHPFYSTGPRMMLGSVSLHFINLVHVKRWETCVQAWLHYFGIPKLQSLRSSPMDPKWCLGVFWSILLTFRT
jgi:hypothetical protein